MRFFTLLALLGVILTAACEPPRNPFSPNDGRDPETATVSIPAE